MKAIHILHSIDQEASTQRRNKGKEQNRQRKHILFPVTIAPVQHDDTRENHHDGDEPSAGNDLINVLVHDTPPTAVVQKQPVSPATQFHMLSHEFPRLLAIRHCQYLIALLNTVTGEMATYLNQGQ
jgi:hypothetical protein